MTPFGLWRQKTFLGTATSLYTSLLFASAALFLAASPTHAQGSRKDDVAFGTNGRPVADATITVCSSGATGTPCTPLATLYTDATLTHATPNPFQSDGLGNYHFYAAPGRYVVQVSGPGIDTHTMNDTILPNDPATPSFNSVTATSMSLGGNLRVGGDASVSGMLSSGSFAPSSIRTSSLQVSGNAAFKGPRPWVDVTAPPYGAKGDGSTDDTAAIKAAIMAACTSPNLGGAIFFPPGMYVVTSTINFPCVGLTIQGGSTRSSGLLQFSKPPQTIIRAGGALAGSRATGAVFLFNGQGSAETTTLRDLQIQGYNQGVQLYDTVGITFNNVCISAANTRNGLRTGATDTTDNTPLAVYNTFWIWFTGGCLLNTSGSASPATPVAVFAFITGSPAPQTNLGLFQFRDSVVSGGGFVWDCRSSSECPSGGGNVFFDDVYMENATMPFYTVNNTAGASNPGGAPAIFVNSAMGDCFVAGQPFVYENGGSAQGVPDGMIFNNISPCVGGLPLEVVSGNPGSFTSLDQSGYPTNSAGVPIGNFMARTVDGTMFWSYPTGPCGYSPDQMTNAVWSTSGCSKPYLPPIALGKSGDSQANLGISPFYGYQFGDGTHYGYESRMIRNSTNTLDFEFACAISPTGLTATPTTGGSLAKGKYYYSIQSACASGGAKSAGSLEVSITLSGSNNAVSLSWTAPAGTNPGSCNVYRSRSSGGTFSGTTYYTVSDCTRTTTYTDTGAAGRTGANQLWNASLGAYYRFAPSSANPNGGTVEIGLSGTTGSIGGSALSAGQCTTGKVSVTNAAISMPVAVSPSTWPGDGFSINAYVSALGIVTVKVCAIVAGTPNATKYNVRVLQ